MTRKNAGETNTGDDDDEFKEIVELADRDTNQFVIEYKKYKIREKSALDMRAADKARACSD